jgi:SAM-dependent methyltransferase
MPCLSCGSKDLQLVLPLGHQPLANSYLKADQLEGEEPFFPLELLICEACTLAQIEAVATSEDIFSDYAYFSSFSTTWLDHAERYVNMITDRLGLGADSQVIEIASNDGYLLQYFQQKGVPCLGIEPAANVAEAAREKGINTRVAFWNVETADQLADEGLLADLILGNNVLAHVPVINDFVGGIPRALKPEGTVTMEFPHLMRLVEENQFDTIYHEHFFYYALFTVQQLFANHGLRIYDVEELPTHGGSLRIFACHRDADIAEQSAVQELLEREKAVGMHDAPYYEAFAAKVAGVKEKLLAFLRRAREEGKCVAAYGAPAKGNTLLNYCGVGPDDIAYTMDRNPHKQGLFLPGSHIPIRDPDYVYEQKPDYLIILPWNLRDEIAEQMAHIREWGGQFVVPIPEVTIF